MFKKTKSKNIIKRGFNKLKGKIQVRSAPSKLVHCLPMLSFQSPSFHPPTHQGRSHTFEHSEVGGAAGFTPSMTASPSHPGTLTTPHPKEGSMSSNLSISSTSTGRHSDGATEEADGVSASSLVARGPVVDSTPYVRPKKRSSTLPHLSRPSQTPGSTTSGVLDPDLMSLEDFLNESDKTPNRRKVMELKRVSLIIGTPVSGSRDSIMFSAASTGSASGSFSTYQEFLNQLQEDVGQSPIPEVEESELDHSLHAVQGRGSRMSSRSRASSLQPNQSTIATNSNNNNSSSTEVTVVSALASMTSLTPGVFNASRGSSSGTASTTSSPELTGSNSTMGGGEDGGHLPVSRKGSERSGVKKALHQQGSQKVSGLVKATESRRATFTSGVSHVRRPIHGSCDDIARVVKFNVGKPPLLLRQFHKSTPALDHTQNDEDVRDTDNRPSVVEGKQYCLPQPPVVVAAELSHAHSRESLASSDSEGGAWCEYGNV